METWGTVLVAFIVALSTLGATFIQSWQSNKRLKIELGRAIDVDARRRRWEVRSKPLLKLRNELAIAATKHDRFVRAVYPARNASGNKEVAEKLLQEAAEDFTNYIKSGNLDQIVLLQFDKEIEKEVNKILQDYGKAYFDFRHHFDELTAPEREKSWDILNRNKTRIIEVQELINKHLEEL